MPTPVTAARQCLTPEAALALDEAVAVARRRGHSQTTSLHAVSGLLSTSSPLRDACARARNSAYSPRLQFKALELCLGVSLDRISSVGGGGPAVAEPPVSNSLMAAIKRSQANQRRQPENYHLYHHQIPNSQSTAACVKVELQHLTLSILDDPVVSRVLGEAGFRSSDIKMAILRPFSQLLKYSRYRGPPVFLCNIGLGFPPDVDENSRRIAEVLARSKGRNPLLVGAFAYDALRSFTESMEKQSSSVLPPGLAGLTVVSVESEVSSNGGLFGEARRVAERSSGPGIVVSFGDVDGLVEGDLEGSRVVGEISRLMEDHGRRVWVIGATASHERYLKFVTKFPAVEKDWDLHPFPITSLRSDSSMAESYPRSSLMESFVPFGGFFSAPPTDLKFPLNSSFQEIPYATKRGFVSPFAAAEHCQPSLPSWLHMAAFRPDMALAVKTKDDGGLLNVTGHHRDNARSSLARFPTIVGFQSSGSKEKSVVDLNSCMPLDVENISSSHTSAPLSAQSRSKDESLLSKGKEHESSVSKSPNQSVSCTSTGDANQRSPVSATSVTTDLGLGISFSTQTHTELQQDDFEHPVQSTSPIGPGIHDGNFDPGNVKMLFRALSERVGWQWEAISAISQAIVHCRTRERHHGSKQIGDMWLSFVGPDKYGKKKIAGALAEVLYGKRESLICVDLSSQNGMVRSKSTDYDAKFRSKNVVDHVTEEMSKKPPALVFLENVDECDVLVRRSLSRAISTGKFSDSYGREVSTNNMTFVTTSTFSKGHGSIIPETEFSNYSEERILKAKCLSMRIVVEHATRDIGVSQSGLVFEGDLTQILMNKRKLIGVNEPMERNTSLDIVKRAHTKSSGHLDLNLPPEETDEGNYEHESKAWLKDFLEQVDETVVFKPVEFDALAEKIFKHVKDCFRKTVNSTCLLEIESRVMEQLIAAMYLLDEHKVVENWVDQVLGKGFEEIQRSHNSLSAHSVVKLMACEGQPSQAFYLPPRIIIN